jgi:uncharacterized protein YlxW (UPF0749 family)
MKTKSVAEVKEFILTKLREERSSIDALLAELENKSQRMDRELISIKARAGAMGAIGGIIITILGIAATYFAR